MSTRPAQTARVELDWSHPSHQGSALRDCRLKCGLGPTLERDDQGRPCHRGCAEAELARERLGQLDRASAASFADERVPPPAETHFRSERSRRPGAAPGGGVLRSAPPTTKAR